MEQYKNEPVTPTREERENTYLFYCLLIRQGEISSELSKVKEGRFCQLIQKALQEKKAETLSEAVDYVKAGLEGGVYKELADTHEEAMGTLWEVFVSPSRHFLDTREESFRLAFSPYVEGVLLAGLRAGILVNTWWRLANYGFSVEPYNKGGERVAFPYRSVSEMKKKDRDAFRLLEEDFYSELELLGSSFHITEPKREPGKDGEVDFSFRPYPKEGFTAEEIAERYSQEEPIQADELYESWEWDIELFLPFLVNRFEESLYYALKYPGNEYKRHIESLNVREDWDAHYGETEYSYGKIFGEEA